MPEGPELHCSAKYVNRMCEGRLFSGKVVKSAVSTKNPDVDWDVPLYSISATARGKEVKLTLTQTNKTTDKKQDKKGLSDGRTLDILVRFGMSGKFCFNSVNEMEKHAHLNFFTSDGKDVLSFVDYRRFGRWEVTSDWGQTRGPCVITEHHLLRDHVLSKLESSVFSKSICEVLLDQNYFNGIGNYLRAEILYRAGIPPFVSARSVLQDLVKVADVKVKQENSDIIDLCNIVALEVVKLNEGIEGHMYGPKEDDEGMSAFMKWLQCYYQPGMRNMVDHNGRTIWFKGEAGPLAPSGKKAQGKKRIAKLADKIDKTDEEVNTKKAKITRTKVKQLASKTQAASEKKRRTSKTKSLSAVVEEKGISNNSSGGKSKTRKRNVNKKTNGNVAAANKKSKQITSKSLKTASHTEVKGQSNVLPQKRPTRSTRSNTTL